MDMQLGFDGVERRARLQQGMTAIQRFISVNEAH